MSDKLTPEQIAEIQDDNVIIDIAGLLAHVAAQDAELAAARAENARPLEAPEARP